MARGSELEAEHHQGHHRAGEFEGRLAADHHLLGGNVHESIVSALVQAGRLLPRRAGAAALHPLSQQHRHGDLDLGGTRSVSGTPAWLSSE